MHAVAKFGSCLLALAFLSAPVWAQTEGSARDQLFEALLADPANEELMLEFARLSVNEGDYEAAASSLERLVDIAPDAQEARYELALGLFRTRRKRCCALSP